MNLGDGRHKEQRLATYLEEVTGISLKVRGDRRKGRVNVMGALRYSDKKRFVDFLNKSNSKNFYEVLKIFYQEIIEEHSG